MSARAQWTGRAPAPEKLCTPELLATIVELLPTVGSLRDLCALTGVRLDTMRKETAPFLAIMKLNGTHPKCGCGKDRFHPYGCADSYAKGWPADCLPGHTKSETAVMLERRRIVIDKLVAGERFCDIDRDLGMWKGAAKKLLRFLDAEQLAERSRQQAARLTETQTRRKAA